MNNFIAWLYIMGTIVLGLVIILSVTGWYGLRENMNFAVENTLNSYTGIWTGICMVLIGLLFLSLRVRAGQTTRSISFDNPEGEVTISIKAIEDFVKRVGQDFGQVLELTPVVLPAHDGIKISAKTSLVAGTNVPRLAESIQNSIKSRLQNILGIENVTSVEVHVSKLVTPKGMERETEQQQIDFEEETPKL